MKKTIIAGCGFAGAVCARQMAEAGWQVTVFDRRPHIGGNAYEAYDDAGIRVHVYGPHIFHTNDVEVYKYLSRFTKWYSYEHRVQGRINGQLVPIPFNLTSLETLFPTDKAERIKSKLERLFPKRAKISVMELQNNDDADVAELGDFVIKNVFENYTAKQWGMPVSQVDHSVLDRVPMVPSRDDRDFHDDIQLMPQDGFTTLFENMLNHENIVLRLGEDARNSVNLEENNSITYEGRAFFGAYIYTGPIDALFGHCFGALPYRSLRLDFETLNLPRFQRVAVINYPNDEAFTRITEFKALTLQQHQKTTILREYPIAYNPANGGIGPCYPIESHASRALYEQYRALAGRINGLHLCGRLADYKYYNMDAAVKAALNLVRSFDRPAKQ